MEWIPYLILGSVIAGLLFFILYILFYAKLAKPEDKPPVEIHFPEFPKEFHLTITHQTTPTPTVELSADDKAFLKEQEEKNDPSKTLEEFKDLNSTVQEQFQNLVEGKEPKKPGGVS